MDIPGIYGEYFGFGIRVVRGRFRLRAMTIIGGAMFKPEEIIFAPTSRCNLACAHCRVGRGESELRAADAIEFMKDCASWGVERVGFSGGEPFLRPDFLCEISAAVVANDLLFDRLMTNGVWFDDEEHLEKVLSSVYEAGFDGTLGLSVDAFHGQDIGKLALFLKAVFRIWGRKDCVEIVAVGTREEAVTTEMLRSLAEAIGGTVRMDGSFPARIDDDCRFARDETGEEDRERLYMNVTRVPYSASADEGAWKAESWFRDDYCAGPGNVFYVHPDGSVAVCCGFANENPALIAGTIMEGYETLMERAGSSEYVKTCYEQGLAAKRKELEKAGRVFPGRTDDPCFFCDYLCRDREGDGNTSP